MRVCDAAATVLIYSCTVFVSIDSVNEQRDKLKSLKRLARFCHGSCPKGGFGAPLSRNLAGDGKWKGRVAMVTHWARSGVTVAEEPNLRNQSAKSAGTYCICSIKQACRWAEYARLGKRVASRGSASNTRPRGRAWYPCLSLALQVAACDTGLEPSESHLVS